MTVSCRRHRRDLRARRQKCASLDMPAGTSLLKCYMVLKMDRAEVHGSNGQLFTRRAPNNLNKTSSSRKEAMVGFALKKTNKMKIKQDDLARGWGGGGEAVAHF